MVMKHRVREVCSPQDGEKPSTRRKKETSSTYAHVEQAVVGHGSRRQEKSAGKAPSTAMVLRKCLFMK
jgi:hypothetical protein